MQARHASALIRNNLSLTDAQGSPMVLPRDGRDEDRSYSRIVTHLGSRSASRAYALPAPHTQPTEWWAYESEFKQSVALEALMRRMFELH